VAKTINRKQRVSDQTVPVSTRHKSPVQQN